MPTASQSKDKLESIYRAHHERGQRYGYLFCSGARAPFLQRWIGTGKRILDIGCRDGMLTQYFAEGNSVLGVDIDREALRRAEARLDIETQWLDINEEFPFADQSFDVVVACEIMEHIYLTQPFLERIHRILRPGGLFLGSVPNAFRWRNRMKFLFGKEYESDPTHVHQFSPERLRWWLEQYFSDVELEHVGGKVLPFLKVSPELPTRLKQLYAKDQLWKAQKP
ncbi:MAG: class I SAM-dependent methyltransferase [Chlamydiia bacterium]|nr:class I SAM-dependent methyltransferase [Chlamydiia bacterium]